MFTSKQSNKENLNSPKKFKIDNEKAIVNVLGTSSQSNKFNTKENSIIEKDVNNLNDEITKLEFDINNGDYVIYEYCNDLVRQVQQAKEEEILKLENSSDLLMKQIEQYKQDTTQRYKSNSHLKQNVLKRLEKFKSNAFNLENEKNHVKKSIFNNNFLQFKRKVYLGELIYKDKNVIDAEFDLVKEAQLTLPNQDKLPQFVFYRYFSTGECLLAFGYTSHCDSTFHLFVLNKDKTLKVSKEVQPIGDEYYSSFQVVKDKLVYQMKNHTVVVYDSNLKLINEYENETRLNPTNESDIECDCLFECDCYEVINLLEENKNILIGADESALYFANKDIDEVVEVCTWSFKYLNDIKLLSSTNELRDFLTLKGKYYYNNGYDNVNILNKSNRKLKSIKTDRRLERFEINSNDDLILFICDCEEEKRMISFYDLDGNLKYNLNLKNFYKYLNEDDFEYYDDYEFEYSSWVNAFTINPTTNQICYFDRKTFTFYDLVLDEFISK